MTLLQKEIRFPIRKITSAVIFILNYFILLKNKSQNIKPKHKNVQKIEKKYPRLFAKIYFIHV